MGLVESSSETHGLFILCLCNDWPCLLLLTEWPFSGNYKVQLYDYTVKDYLPSAPGIGMLVEIRDPEDKIILSRVSVEDLWIIINWLSLGKTWVTSDVCQMGWQFLPWNLLTGQTSFLNFVEFVQVYDFYSHSLEIKSLQMFAYQYFQNYYTCTGMFVKMSWLIHVLWRDCKVRVLDTLIHMCNRY